MQKYELLGMIGEGAYGVVLRCRNTETKQVVAIKKFKESEQDAAVKKTTMREVKVLRMLNQTNVVELKEAFRKKGIVCLVFEYVQNNLLEVLEKSPSGLEPELIRSFTYQMLKGLAYMHSLGIIHRDIKPENLLVSEKKVLKICDFGFARPIKRSDEEELTDYVATRWYRPPELLVGAKYAKEIDLWAVGCILGELIDGMPMFPGENQIDQLFLIQKCLGPLTPDQNQIFLKNPRFLGMKFPEISSLNSIEKRYLGKLAPKALNFIKSLLKMEPSERLTAIQALQHPYFDGMRQDDFIRKLLSNQSSKTEQRVVSATSQKDQPPSATLARKQFASPYNPHPYTQKHEQQRYLNETLSKNTRRLQFNRQSRDSSSRRQPHPQAPLVINTQIHSKSVNKNAAPAALKPRHKNISVEKHRHRDMLAKTQGGFYIHPGVIQERRDEDDDAGTYARINKIYGKRTPNIVNRQGKAVASTTQEMAESEDFHSVFQSTGQLPFLVVGKSKDKGPKQKGSINIIINQNTYNYKNTQNQN